MKPRRLAESSQDRSLVILIGNTEPAVQSFVMTVMSQQFSAKSVDGPAVHQLCRGAEPVEPIPDFLGGLVGEGERVDARWIDAQSLVVREGAWLSGPVASGEAPREAQAPKPTPPPVPPRPPETPGA